MNAGTIRGLLFSTLAALAAAPPALAELPTLQPAQTLRPLPDEILPDPQGDPQAPLLGASLALAGNTALAGMPGAFDDEGRVAVFTRSGGKWVRTGTLKANDAASGAHFGNDVALAGGRALVASRTAVYVFAASGDTWRQTQKLKLDLPVQVADLDWNGSIAIVGVGVNDLGNRTNGVYAFSSTNGGPLQRIAKFTAHDTAPADMFGNRVAIAGTLVAITAPGYNADQGAAYVFACTVSGCRQRQKMLANDGKPGDEFGSAVAIRTHVLVVGAEAANPARPEDDGSSGAAYVFLRPNSTWIETYKLGATAAESDPYNELGISVGLTGDRVLVGGVGDPGFSSGTVFVYDFSGGSLIPTHRMEGMAGFGETLAVVSNTALVGTPENSSSMPAGQAGVFNLPHEIP